MKQLLALGLLVSLPGLLAPLRAADDDEDDKSTPKSALQAFNGFIGSWKGSGGPAKAQLNPRDKTWTEELSWSWRFKGDDAWMVMEVKKGEHYKRAELRYLPDKKRYQLSAVTKDDKKVVFTGELKNEILNLERVDADTKETQRIKMSLPGGGARFVYRFEHKPAGKTIFFQDFQVGMTKEGESFGVKEGQKKVECIVSGGLGTIPVSFKGVTYYVCCSGCRDAFNENPEKYVKEFEKKKANKKD